MHGQVTDADEQGPEDGPHGDQGPAGVLGLWPAERGYAVGDRLHPGQRGAPGGEGVEYQQQADRGRLGRQWGRLPIGHLRQVAGELADHADQQHQRTGADEQVGGDGEDAA
jgi:hypothetical protein